jgi:hypothetical protein
LIAALLENGLQAGAGPESNIARRISTDDQAIPKRFSPQRCLFAGESGLKSFAGAVIELDGLWPDDATLGDERSQPPNQPSGRRARA